ncbi:alpha-2-macroglobulin family protein [Pelagicoccus mobilis]|uniref:Alpha-2-macroglobulin domain-containing protein n=1 Tax=Pelagicoccus mobilis TaxID=415221 RepID=A0A934S0A6_9BACT|nr:alpha-2-macroglobulin family protein [Pelagicoccus mobilis]MBK1879568.1 hypothetical protein [Pelagicoccus mobilis]
MNTILRLPLTLLSLLALCLSISAQTRDELWQKVADAESQNLPRTAITHLDAIIESALAEEAPAEAIKAISKKIGFENQIAGSDQGEGINRLRQTLTSASPELKPFLHAMLAHSYWDYFKKHRWQFFDRNQIAGDQGDDFRTWDLKRLLIEIDEQFTAALSYEKQLKATPIQNYNTFLGPTSAPDAYRPTLYEFIAHQALQFYEAGEQGMIEAEFSLIIDADGPALGDVDEFLSWNPQKPDTYSPEFKSVKVYQDLLRSNTLAQSPAAHYDANLSRLRYVSNIAFGEDVLSRYISELERLAREASNHEISSLILNRLAEAHLKNNAPLEAHKIAKQGWNRYPDSIGGKLCYNTIQHIEKKDSFLQTEYVWNAPWPTLDLEYKNLTEVHFRAYQVKFPADVRVSTRSGSKDWIQEKLSEQPSSAWSEQLPPTNDFKSRIEKIAAPTTLAPGYYVILASHTPDFTEEDNQVSSSYICVSDLALVLDRNQPGTPLKGLVLDALKGTPIEGAEVEIWTHRQNSGLKKRLTVHSDKSGAFSVPSTFDNESTFIRAIHDGHELTNKNPIWINSHRSRQTADRRLSFFTDRALYRPGQTVHYKAIAHSSHRAKGEYTTLPNRNIKISFRDANHQEVAARRHETNDFGSFSGSFTIPANGLTGSFSIVSDGPIHGSTYFNVEEYKRPKFQVELTPPNQAPKLDATVSLTGKATAYTGTPIDGAKVNWRVERNTQLPRWCWWWFPSSSKAIAHGNAISEADGTFSIQFNATPDKSVPQSNEPIFNYTIYADVTDSAGETRSTQHTLRIGYTALQAQLQIADLQTSNAPVHIKVQTSSLDQQPQKSSGTLTIYQLKQPKEARRAPLQLRHRLRPNIAKDLQAFSPTEPRTWENAKQVSKNKIKTDQTGSATVEKRLKPGPYRAEFKGKDRFGNAFTAQYTFNVIDPQNDTFATKIPNFLSTSDQEHAPGDTAEFIWGTGYSSGQAFVEIKRDGETIDSFWTEPESTQTRIQIPITEKDRGGLSLLVTYVRENRAYLERRLIQVPWTNKQLSVKWERFRSKLDPGKPETWTAIVSGPDSETAAAEMVATLYDASLDQYKQHLWFQTIGAFRFESFYRSSEFINTAQSFQHQFGRWERKNLPIDLWYRDFPTSLSRFINYGSDEEVFELSPFSASDGYAPVQTLAGSRLRSAPPPPAEPTLSVSKDSLADAGSAESGVALAFTPGNSNKPDLSQVAARKNLAETAFFYPHLISDENGIVKIQFTMPEALTKWCFLGFAHDQNLRSGLLADTAITAKDLMVEPNPPRFLREGDEVEFTVKVSNQSDSKQTGRLRLSFSDAATLDSADEKLQNLSNEKSFTVPAKQSRSYSWRIKVPDGAGVLTYKAIGGTDTLSDGEEGFLPVLSRRILVTESLPLPIRDAGKTEFELKKLIESDQSDTLQNQSLTVQMVSQPAWYAVMALPYLMEYPHECSEQLFNRYYANTLAAHIANSDPKIRRVFELWKNTPALDSPLEKNQELKSVLIEETPWLRQADDESEARRQVGILFDENRLANESRRALQKLAQRQTGDGRWSWFPGGPSSDYITLYLVTGFGRLRHLGADIDASPALMALPSLDNWIQKRFATIQEEYDSPSKYSPSHYEILYLYGRSFFLEDNPISAESRQAFDFFLQQGARHWNGASSLQTEAQLAIALNRFGDTDTATAIIKSLKERSQSSEELGMYWADNKPSWWWYRAPIETQAMMIEAFAEITQDRPTVEKLKVWLLKQKQTQNWKTTKATADAVYSLLLQGDDLLASDALVKVSLGERLIEPKHVEAGTGYYAETLSRDEITPDMGRVTTTKTDAGVSWGSVHWQYLEDMSKVTPYEGTPLTLKKTLFVRQNTANGPALKPVTGPLSVGDELVVRLELRSDRDMEYLHLKDQRGSGTEPVNVLSGYRYQDGLGYYESTRDAASHFFISHLPKGTYVFEYATRIQLRGRYQSGIAQVQCMYAPEFNSHSQSTVIEVK